MTMKPPRRVRQKAGDKRLGNAPAPESPAPSPLDYALSVMRDEGKPAALRISAAKLAAGLLPKRAADAPDEMPDEHAQTRQEVESWSDLELARRIAHIMLEADATLERREPGKPVEKTETTRLLERVAGKTG
jgi:hypothetical protein